MHRAIRLATTSSTLVGYTRTTESHMDRVRLGLILAALTNTGIGLFSKGFSDNLGAVDPLFSAQGCVGIQLWGLAYLALAPRYATVPAVAFVFCLEKLFYIQHWAFWMSEHSSELPAMIQQDPLTGLFFAIYGGVDTPFMLFFAWVAWHWRAALFDPE